MTDSAINTTGRVLVQIDRDELERLRAEVERLEAALRHKTMADCHADEGTHYSGCLGWEAMRDAEVERLQEVARAAQAVCRRGWITETRDWLKRAVGELNEEE